MVEQPIKSITPLIGTDVKSDLIKRILNRLQQIGKTQKSFAKDESVLGVFKTSGFTVNHLVITNYRIFGVKAAESHGNVVFVDELTEKDIQSIAVQVRNGLFNQKLLYDIEIERNGKKSRYATVKTADVDNIVILIEKIKSSESLISLIDAQEQLAADDKAGRDGIVSEQKQQQGAEREKRLEAKRAEKNELKIKRESDRQSKVQAIKDAKQLASDRARTGQCPKCGSDKLQAVSVVSGGGGSSGGCCNCCCVPGGAGRISPTKTATARMCLNCGNKF